MKALMAEAARLQVQIHAAYLDGEVRGLYSPSMRRVYFDIKLAPHERLEVIAHELGHVFYGHDCTNPRNEEQADRRAAFLLIDPDLYRLAEAENDHLGHIAERLDLSTHIVSVWREWRLPQLVEAGRRA